MKIELIIWVAFIVVLLGSAALGEKIAETNPINKVATK